METEKNFSVEKNQKYNIKKITLETDKSQKYLMRVVFLLDDAKRLTYKPTFRKEQTQMLRGIEVTNTSDFSYEIEKTPEKLFKLNEIINKSGEITIITDVNIMDVLDEQGETKQYRFLNNKNFEDLKGLDAKGKIVVM